MTRPSILSLSVLSLVAAAAFTALSPDPEVDAAVSPGIQQGVAITPGIRFQPIRQQFSSRF